MLSLVVIIIVIYKIEIVNKYYIALKLLHLLRVDYL